MRELTECPQCERDDCGHRDSRGRYVRARLSCHEVRDWECDAPANLAECAKPTRLPTCFACGQPVCRKCSRVVKWYGYGRKRVAESCIEEHGNARLRRPSRESSRLGRALS